MLRRSDAFLTHWGRRWCGTDQLRKRSPAELFRQGEMAWPNWGESAGPTPKAVTTGWVGSITLRVRLAKAAMSPRSPAVPAPSS
jgi:hypothetical protein